LSEFTITIERIGARGDGVAEREGRALFLPLTAPGDMLRVRETRGGIEILERLRDGARQAPPCPHFGSCGGCALQHLRDDTYAEAKTSLVREALAHRGLDPGIVAPLERLPPATRRRARLALSRSRKGTVGIGFHERGSHRIVDMLTCLVLHTELLALAPALRALAEQILRPGETAALSLTRAATGIDLLLDLPRMPDLAQTETLGAFATAHDLARLSWRHGREAPTPVVQRRPVRMSFAGIAVDLPPDAFLQASADAEALLGNRALAFLGDSRAVADLFCGVGTFTLPLAGQSRVHAVDGDAAAIAALNAAARRAGLGARVTAEVRDLDRRPLRAEELAPFDAVLFDPPYAGAKAQAMELARAKPPRIVAISCHPSSFARDARLLVDGGYRLLWVVPVDQFVWSAELELVAAFER
jgi:23S rRNA (uracil1939-C5)-methyltransferase